MTQVHGVLRSVRESLGLPLDFVERKLSLSSDQLGRIERGEVPLKTALADELAGLYGVPSEDLAAGLPAEQALEPVRVLLKASTRDLSYTVRSDIARVAAARRDLKQLEVELKAPDRYTELRKQFRHEGVYEGPGAEWRPGRDLAQRLREYVGLDSVKPIESVRDLIFSLGIELVEADLHDPRVAGFSLADSEHGPSIVINQRGSNAHPGNANPWVRRFTIAHELCHVLHDEKIHRELVPVQLYDEDSDGAGPEPRANAFAAYFLCPDEAVRNVVEKHRPKRASLGETARSLMETYGINFKTARYRLIHSGGFAREDVYALRDVPTAPDPLGGWYISETLWDGEYFACPSVPLERRGRLARLVVEAWTKEILDRHQALELLKAAPDEALESLRELPALE